MDVDRFIKNLKNFQRFIEQKFNENYNTSNFFIKSNKHFGKGFGKHRNLLLVCKKYFLHPKI